MPLDRPPPWAGHLIPPGLAPPDRELADYLRRVAVRSLLVTYGLPPEQAQVVASRVVDRLLLELVGLDPAAFSALFRSAAAAYADRIGRRRPGRPGAR